MLLDQFAALLPARVRDRFMRKLLIVGECWTWTACMSNGYGLFTIRPTPGSVRAHRFSYESAVGPIAAGLVLDHLCRNRACVRPDHLEPVTDDENKRRGSLARSVCRRGLHALSPDDRPFTLQRYRCRKCLASKLARAKQPDRRATWRAYQREWERRNRPPESRRKKASSTTSA